MIVEKETPAVAGDQEQARKAELTRLRAALDRAQQQLENLDLLCSKALLKMCNAFRRFDKILKRRNRKERQVERINASIPPARRKA